MSVLFNHLNAFPSSHFLQGRKWNASLHKPACPSVPEVVKTEILDARFFKRGAPGVIVIHPHFSNCGRQRSIRSMFCRGVNEHPLGMFSRLPFKDIASTLIQSHANCLTRLRLFRWNPCDPTRNVN
ncbi:Uncharacterised protein [Klebsiella pneumoniae]|nr:Uncharacterised protein [Klebsiella pneumoniae]